ncbi:MAG: hypothetical protein AAFZ15_19390 [Bacteroidota bacterium]
MKKTIISMAFLFSCGLLTAQTSPKNIPISLGYFGHYAIQPGLKVGTQFNLKEWKTAGDKKGKTITKYKSFFIGPQLGFFSFPGNHTSFLISADLGYKRIKSPKNKYSAFSIGLGYLAESRVLSMVIDLSDGGVNNKEREWRNYFLPTINYEFGRQINPVLSWYGKSSLGMKLSTEREGSMSVFTELGVKININEL